VSLAGNFILKQPLLNAGFKSAIISAALVLSAVIPTAAELPPNTSNPAERIWYGKVPEPSAVIISVVFDPQLFEYIATFGGGFSDTTGHGDGPIRCLQIEPEAVTEIECKALFLAGSHWGFSMPLKVSLHPKNDWKSR
jgi:hypothetical protein